MQLTIRITCDNAAFEDDCPLPAGRMGTTLGDQWVPPERLRRGLFDRFSGSSQFAGWTRYHFVTAGLIRGESTRCPGLGRCSVEHPRDLSMELLA